MKQANLQFRASRRPLSTLSKVMITALVINLCAELFGLFAQLIFEGFVSIPLMTIGVVLLIAIGLVITISKRWVLLLSGLVVLATSVSTVTRPGNVDALLHPAGDNTFLAVMMAIILLTALVAIVVGIVAVVQNKSDSQQLVSH